MYDYGGSSYFMCDECPIVDGWRSRLYHSITDPEYGEPQADHCECDKIGHYFYAGGYCADAWCGKSKKNSKGKRKYGRAYRRAMTRKADERRRRMIREGQRPDFWWACRRVDGVYQNEDYIQPFRTRNYERFCKKQASRTVRREKELPSGKSGYRKCYDLAWKID